MLKGQLPRVVRTLKYILWDAKYGSWYLGAKLKTFGLGNDVKGWHGAQSSDYDALKIMFSKVTIRPDDVIVDIGCGRGRLFNFLLHQGFKNKMIGVEVDHIIAEQTRKRLKKHTQVEILESDIEYDNDLLDKGSIFYLFNPFTDRIVKKFSDNLIKKIDSQQTDRPMIIYYNCGSRLYIFEENPCWQVKKLGAISHTQLQAAIITPRV